MKKSKELIVINALLVMLAVIMIVSCSKSEYEKDLIPERVNEKNQISSSHSKSELNSQFQNEILQEIPAAFSERPEEYVTSLLKTKDVIGGDDCIFIDEFGIAWIAEGCSVNNQIPDYGCAIIGRAEIASYPLGSIPGCHLKKVWVILLCPDVDLLHWYTTWVLDC